MKKLLRWLPALALMGIIFAFSATAAQDLPVYGRWDYFIKKGAHMTEYGLLALAYWYPLRRRSWAWGLAALYALSDELHQSFTPGRHPAWQDVLLFDAGGAALSMALLGGWFQLRSGKTPRASHKP